MESPGTLQAFIVKSFYVLVLLFYIHTRALVCALRLRFLVSRRTLVHVWYVYPCAS